ncbi:uncharacterized protein [Penaeus vannamei]|uniref:uncharacterized protein isoform X1 n=1 Tax=Penaeus vannamei TaxID=6689 RepID=UPI00387FAB41
MKTLILSLLLAVAERPSLSYDAPAPHTSSPVQQIPIIRDERVHPAADGTYSFDVETGDGIVRNESGGPVSPSQMAKSSISSSSPILTVTNLSRPSCPSPLHSPTQSPPTPSNR